MLKNENGCPCMATIACNSAGSVQNATDNGNIGGMRPREGCSGMGAGRITGGNNRSCGGTGDSRDTKPLAYVYAPDQKFCLLYSAPDALAHGTLFEQLYKPKEVYGREQTQKYDR